MNQHPKNSQGIALLLTIIVMGIVIIIVIAISQLAIVELRLVGGIEDSYVAYYAAETGLEKALLYFKDNPEIEEESFSQGDLPKGSYRYTITPQDGNVYIAASGFSESNWGGVSRKLDLNLKQGPIAIWHFDEGKGNIAYDDSGNDFDITIYDDEDDSWVEGISGGALSFDGEDDYGAIPNATSLNPNHITVEAWFYANEGTLEKQKSLVQKPYESHQSPFYQYSLLLIDNTSYPKCARFAITINGILYSASANELSYDYKQWHHLVGTYDGSYIRLYLDGQLVASKSVKGDITSYDTPVQIGAYPNLPKTSNYCFGGKIDEVKIYKRALSEEEITDLYNEYK